MLKEEGRIPARIRNWAFVVGIFLLVGGGMLQDYI
jgi:hypothetical protein